MDGSDIIPAEFDVLTVIFLVRPDDAPTFTDEELERIQSEHLAYLNGLGAEGLIVVNGPLVDQSDISMRGMSVWSVGAERALALASADPMVRAGRLQAKVARWWSRPGLIAFPLHPEPVADRLPVEAMRMR